MTSKSHDELQAALASKRTKAISYLREHGIYRGDINCRHRYEQHRPEAMWDHSIEVTVCRVNCPSVTHAMRVD